MQINPLNTDDGSEWKEVSFCCGSLKKGQLVAKVPGARWLLNNRQLFLTVV